MNVIFTPITYFLSYFVLLMVENSFPNGELFL